MGEVWDNLHAAFPELMWRLSLEQGPPSFWVRLSVNGRRLGHPPPRDLPVEDGSEMTLVVVPGGPAGTR